MRARAQGFGLLIGVGLIAIVGADAAAQIPGGAIQGENRPRYRSRDPLSTRSRATPGRPVFEVTPLAPSVLGSYVFGGGSFSSSGNGSAPKYEPVDFTDQFASAAAFRLSSRLRWGREFDARASHVGVWIGPSISIDYARYAGGRETLTEIRCQQRTGTRLVQGTWPNCTPSWFGCWTTQTYTYTSCSEVPTGDVLEVGSLSLTRVLIGAHAGFWVEPGRKGVQIYFSGEAGFGLAHIDGVDGTLDTAGGSGLGVIQMELTKPTFNAGFAVSGRVGVRWRAPKAIVGLGVMIGYGGAGRPRAGDATNAALGTTLNPPRLETFHAGVELTIDIRLGKRSAVAPWTLTPFNQ